MVTKKIIICTVILWHPRTEEVATNSYGMEGQIMLLDNVIEISMKWIRQVSQTIKNDELSAIEGECGLLNTTGVTHNDPENTFTVYGRVDESNIG